MDKDERKAWEELVAYTRMDEDLEKESPASFIGPMKCDESTDDIWSPVYNDAILSADAELTSLRGEVAEMKDTVTKLIDRELTLQATLTRYREAVEWALSDDAGYCFGEQWQHEDFRKELRRRAEEGE